MSDDDERARLEAIVFGRDDAVSDAERDAAGQQLARLLEVERERESAARTAVGEAFEELDAVAQPKELSGDPLSDDPPREKVRHRWRRPVLLLTITIVVVVVTGVVVAPALMSGRPIIGGSDSMAIFDRPQTERDLEYPAEFLESPDDSLFQVIRESVRYLGATQGYELYTYKMDVTGPEQAEATSMPCLLVIGDQMKGGPCFSEGEFSAGPSVRFEESGTWTEVAWDIDHGISVTTGELPPERPAAPVPKPLSVFNEEQDDADLNALAYLPDIPPSQQHTVRFLGSSAGYYAAAYRGADDAVCLAVYEGGTVLATSESVCVSEPDFEDAGIQLSYPTAAPEISVTWGPGPGVAFGGR